LLATLTKNISEGSNLDYRSADNADNAENAENAENKKYQIEQVK
jgi:hypothetical protein